MSVLRAQRATEIPPPVADVLRRCWGFDALRPLQGESIGATLAGRDSLTVLPTGGGKSLCYQVPPMVTGRLTLVVSPLIALMQDQVAGLRLAGVPAAALHANLPAGEGAQVRESIASGRLRLLLVAPERLLMPDFLAWVARMNVGAIAIDEAHCISQWGHDFRPEYRRLAELRDALPGVPMGAYTATATPRVQRDIVEQLRLDDPAVLVGSFDRPNLTYRVLPRVNLVEQTIEALGRHPDRAAIVYCISRKDTEELAGALAKRGIDARAYHAGLDASERTRISADFRAERLGVVCATVAFGMGIDRSDVRCVIHAAMPRSIEAYQQETGRAGRDGLPGECLLLYAASDYMRWKNLAERSASESGASPAHLAGQIELLNQMHRLASSMRCRHRAIIEYFGQEYPALDCGACDVCLRELADVTDAHDTARKIISCVARCNQQGGAYGAAHLAEVLTGANTAKVRERGHAGLSTHGLLRHLGKDRVVSYINQLVDAGHLVRESGEFPMIHLSDTSGAVLRSEARVTLIEPKVIVTRSRTEQRATGEETPLTGPESALFDELRRVRRELAQARGVPPYVILGDASLQEIARVRPGSRQSLVSIRGIGSKKLEDFGDELVNAVRAFCAQTNLTLDARPGSRPRSLPPADEVPVDEVPARPSAGSIDATAWFARGSSIQDVMAGMQRARGTVVEYLVDYIARERPTSIGAWVSPSDQARVLAAIEACGSPGRLRPIFEHLGGEVDYDAIKIVSAHRAVGSA